MNNRKAAAPSFNLLQQQDNIKEPKTVQPKTRRSRASVKRITTYNQSFDFNSLDIDKIKFQEDQTKNLNKSVYKRLVGLINLGNTCYMNSTLQCLIHSDIFIKRFISERKKINSSKYFAKTFYALLKEVYDQADDHTYISPKDFKSAIGKLSDNYIGYSQQDTQEFCRVFLEQINQELNRSDKKISYRELNQKGKSKPQLNLEYEMMCRAREDSIVTDTFYGQFINIFACLGCGYESYSFEKFFDIPIIFEGSKNADSISNLFSNYFQNDILQWDTPCEGCKRKTKHSKKIKLGKVPDLLCISIQRFDEVTLGKSSNTIYVEDYLNLKEYVDPECLGTFNYFLILGTGTYYYELYAINNHIGTVDFGHYFS